MCMLHVHVHVRMHTHAQVRRVEVDKIRQVAERGEIVLLGALGHSISDLIPPLPPPQPQRHNPNPDPNPNPTRTPPLTLTRCARVLGLRTNLQCQE